MKYLLITIVFLSCSKSNFSERTIISQQIDFSLNKVQIINSNFIDEVYLSINYFEKKTGKKPDYASFYVDNEANLRLNSFQCDNSNSAKELKEEINNSKGVAIINDVPVIVFYTNENRNFFKLSDEKLFINIVCTLSNPFFDKSYEISNEKLILYDELFLPNTKVEKVSR
jgi:hypothetical protein